MTKIDLLECRKGCFLPIAGWHASLYPNGTHNANEQQGKRLHSGINKFSIIDPNQEIYSNPVSGD